MPVPSGPNANQGELMALPELYTSNGHSVTPDGVLLRLDQTDLTAEVLALAIELRIFCKLFNPADSLRHKWPEQLQDLRLVGPGDAFADPAFYALFKAQRLYALVQADVAHKGRGILWPLDIERRPGRGRLRRHSIASALEQYADWAARYRELAENAAAEAENAVPQPAVTVSRDWTGLNAAFMDRQT